MINFYNDKINKFCSNIQVQDYESCVELLKTAFNAVNEGVGKSRKDFEKDPLHYDFRCLKAIWMNASIKKAFQLSFIKDEKLRKSLKHLKSHGVDYYLLEGKALICFKKMNQKSRVSGFYSKRFKELMNGNKVHYSKKMLDNLSDMGVHRALPVYYIGHVVSEMGILLDVRLVHYWNNNIDYELSLGQMFGSNLFNIENRIDSLTVISKKRAAKSG